MSVEHLLPSVIVCIIFWTSWLPFSVIETRPYEKVKCCNIFAQVALIPWNFIFLGAWFLSHTIDQCINQYLHATPHYSPKIFLQVIFSVKLQIQPGEIISTQSVLFALSPILSCFSCNDRHNTIFNRFLSAPCELYQSGNILCRIDIQRVRDVLVLDAIVTIYIVFIVFLPVVFAHICIIQANWIPLQHHGVWKSICRMPHQRDQHTFSAFIPVDTTSEWYLVSKMYC